MNFRHWFAENLIIGGFPYLVNERFEAKDFGYVINVSDEFYHLYQSKLLADRCQTFWFPMNESKKDVGLNSIYGAIRILWLAENQNKKVYLHCHAGINRSMTVRAAYYFLRTGQQLEEENNSRGYINDLVAMCHRGYLPPKKEMEKFLHQLGVKLDDTDGDLKGGELDKIKINTINNF